jgi:sugar lactone lactonase YvrE
VIALVLALLVLALAAAPAGAEMQLPPGFTAQVYVTGERAQDDGRVLAGIPSASSLAFDASGALYVARTGRRYFAGEVEDVWPLYRIPLGGGRLTRETESRHFYGPPLPNVQLGAVRGGHELLVTTYDRERKLGVLYRIVDGRAELVAGGTPPRGTPPLLRQPEGVALDPDGNIYVADRQHGAVMRLDPTGRVLDPAWLTLTRPRLLVAHGERLWVAADGDTEAPWQSGTGVIWTIRGQERRVALSGPIVSGMDVSPTGHLFVADRAGARILAVGGDGTSTDVVRFTDGDAPRTLGWAPVTEATRRAGIAGDLFVVVIRRGTWSVNDIVRISGPFDELIRARFPAAR